MLLEDDASPPRFCPDGAVVLAVIKDLNFFAMLEVEAIDGGIQFVRRLILTIWYSEKGRLDRKSVV